MGHARRRARRRRVRGVARGRAFGRCHLREACRSLWGIECELVRAVPSAFGLSNGYRDPASLGVDRWLAMLAAWHARREACCVADCGSAVTIDAIDAGGRHLGGLIIPGMRLMHDALRRGTAIPETTPAADESFFGRDTAGAVASGIAQAIAGAIERAVAAASAVGRQRPRLVVTGGDGPAIAEALNAACEIRPALVLEGLALVAQESGR
ncbi:MAG: type III pantothenate kinase [Gammaproteobacteria bacterium]|nr:type III pantothenate kinase [Gammaproteobacteria bacterium]